MSLETWKAEFYPIGAEEAAKGTELEAVEHSIRKWEGLTKENLERHGVRISAGEIKEIGDNDGHSFAIGGMTCSLCEKFRYIVDECQGCPILTATNNECWRGRRSPWFQWGELSDPHPMLRVLNQTREWLIARAPVAPDAPESTGPMETPTEATAAPQEAK